MPYEFRADPKAKRLLPLQVEAPDIEAWMLAKDPTAIGAWNELGPEEYARAFTAARTAGTDVADDLYYALVDTFARNGTEADFVGMVEPVLRRKGWLGGDQAEIASRVRLIYDTNLRLARAAGRWTAYNRSADALPYLRAFTVGDFRVRRPPKSEADHTAWEGIILPITHWFWRQYWPPLGFRCVLPGTRIEGAVKTGVRRWHTGKAVEVTMKSGNRLTVTSDHAVLTGRGWLMAKHIRVGDSTMRHGPVIAGNLGVFGHDHDTPPLAEDLFDAMALHTLGSGEPVAFKFDDQTAVGQREIDVVFANPELAQEVIAQMGGERGLMGAALDIRSPFRGLRTIELGIRESDASGARQASDLALAYAENGSNSGHAASRINDSLAETRFEIGVAVSAGLPSLPALPLHTSRRLFDALPLDEFRLGSASNDDALFAELAAEGCAIDAGLFRELLHAFPADVASDEVVDIREFDFSGHVYDFQTDESLFSANGTVVHNCRCEVAQMTRSQFLRSGGTVTSETELDQRIAQIGPPVFMAPGVPIERRLEAAVERTNAERVPGLPPVNPRLTTQEGEDAFDAVLRASTLRDITRQLATMGF